MRVAGAVHVGLGGGEGLEAVRQEAAEGNRSVDRRGHAVFRKLSGHAAGEPEADSSGKNVGDQPGGEERFERMQIERQQRQRNHQPENAQRVQPRRHGGTAAAGEEESRIAVDFDHAESPWNNVHAERHDLLHIAVRREEAHQHRGREEVDHRHRQQKQEREAHRKTAADADAAVEPGAVVLADHGKQRNAERHREDESDHFKPSGRGGRGDGGVAEGGGDPRDDRRTDRHHQHADGGGDGEPDDQLP